MAEPKKHSRRLSQMLRDLDYLSAAECWELRNKLDVRTSEWKGVELIAIFSDGRILTSTHRVQCKPRTIARMCKRHLTARRKFLAELEKKDEDDRG